MAQLSPIGVNAVQDIAQRQAERPPAKEPVRHDKPAPETRNPYLPDNLPSDYGVNLGNFTELDTPTYLRRQMD